MKLLKTMTTHPLAKSSSTVALLGMLCVPSLRADILFSNLGQPLSGQNGMDDPTRRLATDFATGDSPTTITNATLLLFNSEPVGRTMMLSLFTDSGSGTPGTLVGSFDIATVSAAGVFQDYSFSSSVGINLADNTPYWAVLQLNDALYPGAVSWGRTINQLTDVGSVFSTIPATQVKYSANSGANWSDAGFGNFQFRLEGMVVPEPATFTLVGVGLLGVCLLHRRRTR